MHNSVINDDAILILSLHQNKRADCFRAAGLAQRRC